MNSHFCFSMGAPAKGEVVERRFFHGAAPAHFSGRPAKRVAQSRPNAAAVFSSLNSARRIPASALRGWQVGPFHSSRAACSSAACLAKAVAALSSSASINRATVFAAHM